MALVAEEPPRALRTSPDFWCTQVFGSGMTQKAMTSRGLWLLQAASIRGRRSGFLRSEAPRPGSAPRAARAQPEGPKRAGGAWRGGAGAASLSCVRRLSRRQRPRTTRSCPGPPPCPRSSAAQCRCPTDACGSSEGAYKTGAARHGPGECAPLRTRVRGHTALSSKAVCGTPGGGCGLLAAASLISSSVSGRDKNHPAL